MTHAIDLNGHDFRQGGLLARLRGALASHRAYAALHAELAALSDRELDDLGLSRHSIRDIARAAAYGN